MHLVYTYPLINGITYMGYDPAVKGTRWNRIGIGLKIAYCILFDKVYIMAPYWNCFTS